MNDKTTPSSNPPEHAEPTAAGLTRRRLVRAGLTAAPVMAALHSNTVLAGGSKGFGHGCIRPSTFSSLKAANWTISQGRDIQGDFVCRPHSHWKNNFPQKFKKVNFLSDVTKCNRDPQAHDRRNSYKKLKMHEVLELPGDDVESRLAQYVVAAFLSADVAGYDSDRVWLTKRQCHEIWNGRGNWKPFAGANWDLNQTMNYFEVIFARS
jgi:hypothetical protein